MFIYNSVGLKRPLMTTCGELKLLLSFSLSLSHRHGVKRTKEPELIQAETFDKALVYFGSLCFHGTSRVIN